MIDELLRIEGVTDILINGPNSIWIDCGSGMKAVDSGTSILPTAQDVRALALDLARKANARLDDASPIVDAQLPGGVRLHAVLAPIADVASGAIISLRTKSREVFGLKELFDRQMFSEQQMHKLKKIAKSKKNVIVSGATGSGKTTLMSALLKEVPENERIVGIEEAKELNSDIHPGLVLLSGRRPNSEGFGEIKLSELLKATLRMRPDRIVLGECRGDEVREFLLALGAGYSGSLTTIHANSAEAVRDRVETLSFMAGVYSKLAENQFNQYVDVVIHVKKYPTGRKIEQILELNKNRKVNAVLADL